MPGGPCAADPTSTKCIELMERVATQVPEKLEELAAQIPAVAEKLTAKVPAGAETLTDVLKSNAPAVMERLNAAIAHIGEWVETGEAFATEQVPLLVTEIIYWGVASAAFWVVLGACFLLAATFAFRFGFKRWTEWSELDCDPEFFRKVPTCVIVIVGGAVGFFMFTCNFMDMLKPLLAPRLYLIEYFQQLVR